MKNCVRYSTSSENCGKCIFLNPHQKYDHNGNLLKTTIIEGSVNIQTGNSKNDVENLMSIITKRMQEYEKEAAIQKEKIASREIEPVFYYCNLQERLIPIYANYICHNYLVIRVKEDGVLQGGFGYFTEEEVIIDKEKRNEINKM